MEDDWSEALRRAGDGLRPGPGAMSLVDREVRRRRLRRRAVAAGAAAVVVGVGAALVALPRGEERTAATDPAIGPDDALFTCPQQAQTPARLAPSRETRESWAESREAILSAEFAGFSVHHAQVTGIGVVVLATGDIDSARHVLTQEYGAAAVEPWQAGVADVGLDEDGQIDQAVGWALAPALREVRRRTRGLDGAGPIGNLPSSGALFVQWKEPVPAQVRALEALTFEGGARVVVMGVRYSSEEILRAQEDVVEAVRAEQTVDWASASSCGDGSGLVVGITPETLGDQREELQDQLALVAGMPVMVVPEERPVPLVGRDVG